MGIEVSRFCFHEKLLIAGNCRLCLVHVDKIPKPVVSCAMPVSAIMDNTNIYTDSPQALRAHESVLEFLLIIFPIISFKKSIKLLFVSTVIEVN